MGGATEPVFATTGRLGRLAEAFRIVLANAFDEQFRALASARDWYSDDLPTFEVFRLWVCDNVQAGTDALWVFDPVRASERPLLCDALGIPRLEIVGSTPQRLAHRVLDECGISLGFGRAARGELDLWEDIVALIEDGDDERASVKLRSSAERLLKKVLHFHCATSIGNITLHVLRNPGVLRLPKAFSTDLTLPDAEALPRLTALLAQEGGADLGFLTILLRKVDARLGDSPISLDSYRPPVLFTAAEQTAFEGLAQALQSYAHDKPSHIESRRGELLARTLDVLDHVRAMVTRGAIPEEGIVRERGESLYGGYFRVQNGGEFYAIGAEETPEIGERVVFTRSSPRDFSAGRWVSSPWPIE
jgi:hypothetical protein